MKNYKPFHTIFLCFIILLSPQEVFPLESCFNESDYNLNSFLSPKVSLNNNYTHDFFIGNDISLSAGYIYDSIINEGTAEYFSQLLADDNQSAAEFLSGLSADARREQIFSFFKAVNAQYASRKLFIDAGKITSAKSFFEKVAKAYAYINGPLPVMDDGSADKEYIYNYFQEVFGLSYMWGDTIDELKSNFQRVLEIGSDDVSQSRLKENIDFITNNLLIFNYYKDLSSDGKITLLNDFAALDADKRADAVLALLYETSHKNADKKILLNDGIIKSIKDIRGNVKNILKNIDRADSTELNSLLNRNGFLPGWGNDKENVKKTFNSLDILLNNNAAQDQSLIKESLLYLVQNLPIVWTVEHYSPHGFFNQNGVLGVPDTGGQVVYILDLARKTVDILESRLDKAGLSQYKDKIFISVITRLIEEQGTITDSDWEKIKSNVAYEPITGTDGKAAIVRIPFYDQNGEVIPEFWNRFAVLDFMPKFSMDAFNELAQIHREKGISPKADILYGHYSDGGLAALAQSLLTGDNYFQVLHASERSKNKGIITYDNLRRQTLLDVLTYLSGSAISSSSMEKDIQFPESFVGQLRGKEDLELLMSDRGAKIQVDPLGVEVDFDTITDKDIPEFITISNELVAFAQTLPSGSSEQKKFFSLLETFLNNYAAQVEKGMVAKSAEDAFSKTYKEISDFLKEKDLSSEKSTRIFMTMARIDSVKNTKAMVEIYTGGRDFTSLIARYILDNTELKERFEEYISDLDAGKLPAVFLDENISKQFSKEISEKLEQIKYLRANTISLIIGGAESPDKAQTEEERDLMMELLDIRTENGLERNVLKWKGRYGVPVFKLMRLLDATFVQPAYEENYGLTVIEAMKAGLPIIITENAGAAEVLNNQEFSKYLFNPYSITDLIDKVYELSNMNSNELLNLKQALQKHYEDKCGWQRKAQSMLDFAVLKKLWGFYEKSEMNSGPGYSHNELVKQMLLLRKDESIVEDVVTSLIDLINRNLTDYDSAFYLETEELLQYNQSISSSI